MALQLDTKPFWIDSAQLPPFPQLDHHERADVLVVGGGIAGLTAAYLLATEGKSVVVLERDRCASVDTGHTTAHLTMVTDVAIADLVKRFGRRDAQAAWDAGVAAIAVIDRIARRESIACDFAWVPGYTHVPADPSTGTADPAWYQEQAAVASELGFAATYVQAVPVFNTPGVKFERQARFHPRKYLAGLARAITARGGRIYEHSAADEFVEEPRQVKSRGYGVSCDHIVLATHTPLVGVNNLLSATLLQTKLALYSSYAVAGRVPRGTVPDALLWDTADPYHYYRVEPLDDADLVIYGGEDHKTGQVSDTAACYARLEEKLGSLVPGIKMAFRWSGQVVETPDGLPYIGATADRQFAATGFSGNGMTFGTLSGMMAFDQVMGRANRWQALFDPARKKVRGAAWDYVKENKDYPYYLVRDRVAGAEAHSFQEVGPGEGKVVDHNGETVAVYRDPGGQITVCSAVCTHMGCLVEWNTAERTWDCPCHGSRFRTDGSVIGGPAESPLERKYQA